MALTTKACPTNNSHSCQHHHSHSHFSSKCQNPNLFTHFVQHSRNQQTRHQRRTDCNGLVKLNCHAFMLQGRHLASASGDSSVKLWSFEQQRCVATYTDHTQAVWGVAFHDLGDFVASCSLDHSARLWDITTSKCRQSLRCSFHAAMWLVMDSNRWRFSQTLDRTKYRRRCLSSCRREYLQHKSVTTCW